MTILLMFLGLVALVLINVPIAVALAVVASIAMVATQGPDILPNVALVMMDGATNFPLIAIPLFIFAGAIMNASGISRRLIAFASALLGFVRGGLAIVNIGVSMFFAEISGSAVADVAATRLDPDPGDEAARLSRCLRGRRHLLLGDAGGDHSALDTHDPLRASCRTARWSSCSSPAWSPASWAESA